jgi:hypothetical protein
MAATLSPTRSEFPPDHWPSRPSVVAIRKRPSLVRRAARGVVRLLIIFCSGVAATLAWQSYGDVAREMIASSSPQLGWLALPAAPRAQIMAASAAPATPSPELQQLREMSFVFATVRQSVDQLSANQQQMAGDIAKLVADQQELLQKVSAPAPRPAAAPAPARKPVVLPSSEPR